MSKERGEPEGERPVPGPGPTPPPPGEASPAPPTTEAEVRAYQEAAGREWARHRELLLERERKYWEALATESLIPPETLQVSPPEPPRPPRSGENRPLEILRHTPPTTFDEIEVTCEPLRPAEVPAPPPPAPTSPADAGAREGSARRLAGGGYFVHFANEQGNSRLEVPLPPGEWEVQWQRDLGSYGYPSAVLQAGERVVVDFSGQWQVFDLAGKPIATEGGGLGSVWLEPDSDTFTSTDPEGFLSVRRMEDGREIFRTLPWGWGFWRTLVLRRGSKLLVVSIEPPTPNRPGERSGIEVIGFASGAKLSRMEGELRGEGVRALDLEWGRILVDDSRRLRSREELGTLRLAWNHPLVAVREDEVIFALQDHLFVIDLDLAIRRTFRESFQPRSLSLDETGRTYLVVEAEGFRGELWIVRTATGELERSIPLPGGTRLGPTPPIVGYDGSIFLVAENRIVAFDRGGEKLWEREGRQLHASVTRDGQLLVSAERRVLALDREGKGRTLAEVGGEILSTPPILTGAGKLLTASLTHLTCLTPIGARH